MLGVPITSVRKGHGSWVVNDAIRAPLLVGAGGSSCPVARMMNGPGRGRPLVVAREAEARIGAAELATIAIDADVRSCSSAAICRATAGACAKASI